MRVCVYVRECVSGRVGVWYELRSTFQRTLCLLTHILATYPTPHSHTDCALSILGVSEDVTHGQPHPLNSHIESELSILGVSDDVGGVQSHHISIGVLHFIPHSSSTTHYLTWKVRIITMGKTCTAAKYL